MTTRSVHYVLTGDEVKAYRRALEIWAESASDSRQEMIKELIDRTYDINGEYAKKVDEYMRVDEVFPLWGIIDAECERLNPLEVENRKLPFKQQNHEIGRMLYVLPQVGLKLKLYEVSSTYSAIPPSRR